MIAGWSFRIVLAIDHAHVLRCGIVVLHDASSYLIWSIHVLE